MKKLYSFCIFLFVTLVCFPAFTTSVSAQVTKDKCGSDEYLKQQKKSDPTLEAKLILQEENIQQWINQQYNSKFNQQQIQTVTTIPVVVHIVYKVDSQNISDQRVFDQIAITNRDFAGQNYHSMEAFSSSLKANTNFQFCLAQKKPDGSATNGIERRQTSVSSFVMDNAMKYYSSGGLDAWDPTIYLNIWVCNMVVYNGSYLYSGYAQFPGTGINATYGVVARYGTFGPTDSTYYRGNGGVLTHEIGHCLNLRHIWGDDSTGFCTGTDYCNDTPNQADRSLGVHTGLLTDNCSPASPGVMYMNFMDYSDDIVFANFTPDQAQRMAANFASPNGVLLPLLSSTGCTSPTSCEIPTTLKTTALTKTTATFAWTNMVNTVGYNIRYRKIGTSNWSSTTSSTNSKYITGLTKNTSYEFQVQNTCSSQNGTSSYSSSSVFTTPNTGAPKESQFDNEGSTNTNFSLSPIPASDITTINYSVAESAPVSLAITNSLGIEMVRIINNQMTVEGDYTISYDAGNLTAGIYFLTLRTGNYTGTKKFIIVR